MGGDDELRARVRRAADLRPSGPSSPLTAPLRSLEAFYPGGNTARDRATLGVIMERRSLQLHKAFLNSYDTRVRSAVVAPLLGTSAECRRLVDRLSRSVHGAVGGAGRVLERAGALMDEEKALKDRQSVLERFGQRFMVTRAERAVLAGDWRGAGPGGAADDGSPVDSPRVSNEAGEHADAAPPADSHLSGAPGGDDVHSESAKGHNNHHHHHHHQGDGNGSANVPCPPQRFYAALRRLEHVRRDCAATLLSARHQQAGLDIMDEVSSIQDAAFECLFRWVQRSTASMLGADEPETVEAIACAISALSPRPALLKCALSEAASARRDAVTRRFRVALTRGEGGSRPIELSAHDPLRYAGDMLAWVHQAAAVEGDLFKSLVRGSGVRRAAAGDAVTDAAPPLGAVFDGVARPLETRLDQVITSQRATVQAYKLSELVSFYAGIIAPLVGESEKTDGDGEGEEPSALSQALSRTIVSSRACFTRLLDDYCSRIIRFVPDVPEDLAPPPFVYEGVQTASQILQVYESSLGTTDDKGSEGASTGIDDGDVGFDDQDDEQDSDVTSDTINLPVDEKGERIPPSAPEAVRQLFRALRKSLSLASASLPASDASVLLANSMSVAVNTLVGRKDDRKQTGGSLNLAALRRWAEKGVELGVGGVVSAEAASIASSCGISERCAALREAIGDTGDGASVPDYTSVSSKDGLSPEAVSRDLRSFYHVMFSGPSGTLVVPQCDRLVNPTLRRGAHASIARRLVAMYTEIHTAVWAPGSGYQEPSAVAPHSPQQVLELVGVQAEQ